jgi:hypothetical protein
MQNSPSNGGSGSRNVTGRQRMILNPDVPAAASTLVRCMDGATGKTHAKIPPRFKCAAAVAQ